MHEQGPVKDSTEFHLNLHFHNKRTKFKVYPVTKAALVQVLSHCECVLLPTISVWPQRKVVETIRFKVVVVFE